MKVKPTDKCICGHEKKDHHENILKEQYAGGSFCIKCFYIRNVAEKNWHDFKLDNLSYLLKKYESKS